MNVLAGAIASRGEVPGLFSPEELDGLIAPLADLARTGDFAGTLDQYLYHRKFHATGNFSKCNFFKEVTSIQYGYYAEAIIAGVNHIFCDRIFVRSVVLTK